MAKLNELHLQTAENSTNSGEIVLYQPNETIRLEVRMENETVWLSQAQMADLFQTTRNNITLHIGNIFKENELNKNSVCKDFLLTASDGKTYKTKIYNLDVIISVGYRVKSQRGIQFRIWANQVLKQYLLHRHVLNQRIENLEKVVAKHQEQIDFFIRTSIPPIEGIFHEGQVFDARAFVESLIKQAQKEIIVIDGYIDATTFELLNSRNDNISATIYTEKITDSVETIRKLHNKQYPQKTIKIRKYKENFHDRFLIIDDIVYHFGASFKDLGKRLFAFNKMGLSKENILKMVND